MSIKKIKSFGLILCCILLCACVVGTITVAPKTRADDDVTAITIEQLTEFTTEDAASIRTETPTGIRFTAAISADEYDGLVKQYGLENLEFGMAIARVSSLDALKDKISKATEQDKAKIFRPMSYWAAGAYPGSGAATYKYSFAIVELDENNYNTQYTTIGYVKVGDEIAYATNADGEEAACTRTPLAVATATLAEATEDELEDLSFANAIIDGALSTAEFKVADITAPWGENVTLNATVDGKPVTPVYAVEDATVAKAVGGKIIGLKKGSTTVTAILNGAEDKTYTATATVTFTEKIITPALNSDGMLDLLTAGEETSISVYASDDAEFANALATATTSAATFDIRELIISYMEEKDIANDDYSYTVIVASESYVGTYTSETFVPITQASELVALMTTGANTKVDALNLAGGKYYYLANNIDVSQYNYRATAYGRYSMGAHLEFNLDGRGKTIANEYTHVNASYAYCGFAPYWGVGETTVRNWWKNVHYKANITINSGAGVRDVIGGDLSYYDFYDCYFDVTVTNNASEDIGMFGVHQAAFTNCIFEMTNFSNDASDLVLLRKNDSYTGANLYNCIVINNDNSTDVVTRWTGTNDISASNVYRYYSVADFIAGNNGTLRNDGNTAQNGAVADGTKVYENWSDAWEITDTDVKLFGQTVRTTLQTEVTPVLDANGMLALNTKGEETSINVYASDDVELTTALIEDVTTAQTYDIRELILSYMEDNVTVTGEYSYTVEVESRSYKGTYASEKYIPITSGKEFATKLGTTTANNYSGAIKEGIFFLTTDIDISDYAGQSSGHGVGVFQHMDSNLDGRGHTITNTYTHNASSTYRGISCYWGDDTTVRNWWKNVSYIINLTIPEGYRVQNIMGNNAKAYDFYNCYFEVTVINNNATYNCGLFDVSSCTFNNCIFVLNNSADDAKDVIVFEKADSNCASSSLNNCAIINNSSDASVITTSCTGLSVHTAYRYNNLADFIAGNNGTLRNDDNTAQNGAVADGTKCYTAWDSVWSITDGGISLCGQQIKTVTNA